MKSLSFLLIVSFILAKANGLNAQIFTEDLLIKEYKRAFFFKCIPWFETPESIFYDTYSGMVPYAEFIKKNHQDEISALVKFVHDDLIQHNKDAISERKRGTQLVPKNEMLISRCLDYYEGPLLDSLAKRAVLDQDYYKRK